MIITINRDREKYLAVATITKSIHSMRLMKYIWRRKQGIVQLSQDPEMSQYNDLLVVGKANDWTLKRVKPSLLHSLHVATKLHSSINGTKQRSFPTLQMIGKWAFSIDDRHYFANLDT